MVLSIGFVFNLARFSEVFLLLKASDVGLGAGMIPLMLVIMNVVYSLTAYPVGHFSDRLGRTGLMAVGLAVLIISDLTLSFAENILLVAIGTALWGLHLGFTQGLLSAMVADTVRPNLRGTAFGLFSVAGGLAILIASLIAGFLWDLFGARATFLAGGGFASVTLMGYLSLRKQIAMTR